MQHGSIHFTRPDDAIDRGDFDTKPRGVKAGCSEPPGARLPAATVLIYGRTVRALRNFTKPLDREPTWRVPANEVPWADE